MDQRLEQETQRLIKSWMRHDPQILRDYLVAGVEDPRTNVQSILTRHFLIQAALGERFAALMDHELRFAITLNWLAKLVARSGGAEEFPAILYALERQADNAEGLSIPHFVSRTFAALPATANGLSIPHYLRDWLEAGRAGARRPSLGEEERSTFQRIWRTALQDEPVCGMMVLEPACGSANDYRFLDAFGIARLLDYAGFDLCEKNIRNARAMFPGIRFDAGNAFAIDAPDKTIDVCFVHDLLEHFSVEAMEAAIREMCRVTRDGLCLGFFNMHEEEEHVVRTVDDYHWNTLSLSKTRALFETHGFAVEAIHIGTFLKWRFGCDETHNPNAYTFVITSKDG